MGLENAEQLTKKYIVESNTISEAYEKLLNDPKLTKSEDIVYAGFCLGRLRERITNDKRREKGRDIESGNSSDKGSVGWV
ncbi:MAG: hypothetical protein WC479_05745 [Candidatus Izemoplasmatales bacterium]